MIDSNSVPSNALDRVDQLASALLDQVISEPEIRELGEMLADEPAARGRYLEHMQLHTDLIEHYSAGKRPESPVLSFLGGDMSAVDPPVVAPPADER